MSPYYDEDEFHIRRMERSYEAEIERLRTQKTRIAAIAQLTDAGRVVLQVMAVEETPDGLYIDVQ